MQTNRHFKVNGLILAFILVAICTPLLRCSKIPAGKLTFDVLTVIDQTGEPVKAGVSMLYKDKQGYGASDESAYIGSTNEVGYLHGEFKKKQSYAGFKLRIGQSTHYTVMGAKGGMEYTYSISDGESIVARLQVAFPVRLVFENVNCTSPSDTVWFEAQNMISGKLFTLADTIVGCGQTTLLPTSQPYTVLWMDPAITVNIRSIKSGVTNDFTVYKELSSTEITDVIVNY